MKNTAIWKRKSKLFVLQSMKIIQNLTKNNTRVFTASQYNSPFSNSHECKQNTGKIEIAAWMFYNTQIVYAHNSKTSKPKRNRF